MDKTKIPQKERRIERVITYYFLLSVILPCTLDCLKLLGRTQENACLNYLKYLIRPFESNMFLKEIEICKILKRTISLLHL